MTQPTSRRRWFGAALIAESLVGVAAAGFAAFHGRFEVAGGLLTLTVSALAATKGTQNGKDIREVKVEINSRLSELLLAVKAAAHAEGHAAGIAVGKEQAARDAAHTAGVAAAATATAIIAGVLPLPRDVLAVIPEEQPR